jgi:hypothetical protein
MAGIKDSCSAWSIVAICVRAQLSAVAERLLRQTDNGPANLLRIRFYKILLGPIAKHVPLTGTFTFVVTNTDSRPEELQLSLSRAVIRGRKEDRDHGQRIPVLDDLYPQSGKFM